MSDTPHFRIDLSEGDGSKVWMDGEQIDHLLVGFAVQARAGGATVVTLEYVATVEGEIEGQTLTL